MMFETIAAMCDAQRREIESLFQRCVHRREFGVERSTDAVDGGDNHNADTDRDQAIFDGGRAGFVAQESCK